MSDVTITYKGANIATMDATGSKTLQTAGTYCEGDIGVEYVKPGGGGPVSVPAKEVNFRDYDGTVVYAYTPAEFAALSAMPANPDHSHDEIPLTAQGWNWSFADAQAYVAKYGRLEVGQMYATADGKTHVLIHLEQGRTSPMLGCCPNGTVDVDWGDGTAHDTLTGTSVTTVKWTPTHNYAAPGDYDIKLTCTGTMGLYGTSGINGASALIRYSSGDDTRNRAYRSTIRELYLDSNVGIGNYAFSYCYNLTRVSISHGVVELGTSAFYMDKAVPFLIIPYGVTSIPVSFCSTCVLKGISMPNSILEINANAFRENFGCTNVSIPDGVGSIAGSVFRDVYSITSIVIPASVTSIGGQGTFNSCYGLAEIHLYPTTPPLLGNTDVFANIPGDCIIYVPQGSLNAYQTATNWSTYASRMQEEPQ